MPIVIVLTPAQAFELLPLASARLEYLKRQQNAADVAGCRENWGVTMWAEIVRALRGDGSVRATA
ncbi:hypothetical protein [Stutzerimonas kirkiae]|uniref:Uncharacterized protein n=1 Tax=Stutzerimonas kirkiae TaxID=2211392 RepID=A0A4Q9RA42_9GAMM|nr:hypothetical protein [Stutzerimonas kirkiae]TBU96843.1 hypothetical protein DNJ96_09780 [Stutzerimonas kirkiae]TBV00560.1 hypothetical protein DNJ95_14690 [Stutzerimonas kirkiae]TBV08430.1 hypothetical protein DNK08_10990 [Stutzerimonas kirkiae]TBV13207.1 hypothetical protein DNK01_12170 [Stutzerimonas kirkiae]TBV16706.1 hypothetical protein DNK01_02300 [Stutzerimonas kirkiae]